MSEDLTRRNFLGKASLYGGGLSLAMMTRLPLAEAAAAKSRKPESLSRIEWCAVEAMTGRIIPSQDSPGAIEADCVNFIDKALAHEEKAELAMIQQSIATLNQYSLTTNKLIFCDCTPADQDKLLISLEDDQLDSWPSTAGQSSEFFGFVRALTIMGFLADPKYGGNRDYNGWKLAGYPGPRHHRGGYTDAQMMGEETVAAVWATNN
jgi:gluconate 2-dehydrogenase gamma chain